MICHLWCHRCSGFGQMTCSSGIYGSIVMNVTMSTCIAVASLDPSGMFGLEAAVRFLSSDKDVQQVKLGVQRIGAHMAAAADRSMRQNVSSSFIYFETDCLRSSTSTQHALASTISRTLTAGHAAGIWALCRFLRDCSSLALSTSTTNGFDWSKVPPLSSSAHRRYGAGR